MDLNIFSEDSGLYRAAEWVTRLVYVNILWIFFTLLGLVVFGFMPATLAMFNIMTKWLKGRENVKVFSEYWQYYKENFLKINLLGLIIIAVGAVLIIDLEYFSAREGWFNVIIKYIIYILLFLYILDFIYIFPIAHRYDIKIRYIIKNALFFIFLTPLETLQIILGMISIVIFFRVLPSLLPFLAVSLPVLLISWVSKKTISKVEEKVRKHEQE